MNDEIMINGRALAHEMNPYQVANLIYQVHYADNQPLENLQMITLLVSAGIQDDVFRRQLVGHLVTVFGSDEEHEDIRTRVLLSVDSSESVPRQIQWRLDMLDRCKATRDYWIEVCRK